MNVNGTCIKDLSISLAEKEFLLIKFSEFHYLLGSDLKVQTMKFIKTNTLSLRFKLNKLETASDRPPQ